MDPMQVSGSSYATSSVVNVQFQNCQNVTLAALFNVFHRFKSSTTLILFISFLLYTVIGAASFVALEGSHQVNQQEKEKARNDRKLFELVHRLDSSWHHRLEDEITSHDQWRNETIANLKWYERELKKRSNAISEKQFWNFGNALFFTGASFTTTGFRLNVVKTNFGRYAFLAVSSVGVFLFFFSCWRTGYVVHVTFERILRSCQRYGTVRPQAKYLLIYSLLAPIVLTGQNCLLFYISKCSSYLDVLEAQFYAVSTIGAVDVNKCAGDSYSIRMVLLLCTFTWLVSVCSFAQAFLAQRRLMYEYLFHWLTIQTDESLMMTTSGIFDAWTLLSYYNAETAFRRYLASAVHGHWYHQFLLKSLNKCQLAKLRSVYRKITHRYSQAAQTDPKKRPISRGTSTRPPNTFMWQDTLL